MTTNTSLRLRVGGREYPAYFTMGAQRRYKNAHGSMETPAADDIDAAITFLYCMTRSACNAEGVEFDLDEETFADRLLPEDVAAYFEAFNAAAPADEADADKPKKATPRRR